jgi:hypothetical protein
LNTRLTLITTSVGLGSSLFENLESTGKDIPLTNRSQKSGNPFSKIIKPVLTLYLDSRNSKNSVKVPTETAFISGTFDPIL